MLNPLYHFISQVCSLISSSFVSDGRCWSHTWWYSGLTANSPLRGHSQEAQGDPLECWGSNLSWLYVTQVPYPLGYLWLLSKAFWARAKKESISSLKPVSSKEWVFPVGLLKTGSVWKAGTCSPAMSAEHWLSHGPWSKITQVKRPLELPKELTWTDKCWGDFKAIFPKRVQSCFVEGGYV